MDSLLTYLWDLRTVAVFFAGMATAFVIAAIWGWDACSDKPRKGGVDGKS